MKASQSPAPGHRRTRLVFPSLHLAHLRRVGRVNSVVGGERTVTTAVVPFWNHYFNHGPGPPPPPKYAPAPLSTDRVKRIVKGPIYLFRWRPKTGEI